jgi:membrane fusion protein (multidrug efflux system)
VSRTCLSLAALLTALLLFTACKKERQAGGGPRLGLAVQVVAVQARRQPVTESLSLVGSIAANEMVEIKAETEGIVQEIGFDEGQKVEKGQLLVRLDETKLTATLAEGEANYKLSQANFDRSRQLLRDQLISQQEFDQASAVFEVNRASLERKRRELKDARVIAPFSGLTGARNVSPGQVTSRNTTLTWLVDLDPVKVEMNVPEKFLSQLKLGQSIAFDVTAYPGQKFRGEVYFIAPQLELGTRTALVKTRIANPDYHLKAGMVANLELKLRIRDEAVVIPEVALISNGDASFVFVVDQDQTAQMRPVSVGQRLPRWTEITSGLQGGEWIVVEGHQKVGPGMKVNLAPKEKAAPYLQTEAKPTQAEKS